jgi:hypothetical protein
MKALFLHRMAVMVLAAAAVPASPVAISLAPVTAEALHGCDADNLAKTLRGRLDKAKRFRLVSENETAAIVLEVLECSRVEQRTATFTSKGGPIVGPVGGGVGIGSDSEIGVQTGSTRSVVLRARVGAGSRFIEVAAGPKDRTLREAADTVRNAIDKALGARGTWLVGAPP